MTWPSGTKASTTNVDQGADKIALARPDIKQNIDNVNAIIDTFDISSPSNGDILQYDSSAGNFALATGTSIGLPQTGFVIGAGFNSVPSADATGHFEVNAINGFGIQSAGTEDRWVHSNTGTYIALVDMRTRTDDNTVSVRFNIENQNYDSATIRYGEKLGGIGGFDYSNLIYDDNTQKFLCLFRYTVTNTSDIYKLGWYVDTYIASTSFRYEYFRIDITRIA